ncbi:MAG: hypothetical protein J6Y66_06075 [Bacteroidales bacterium]|nr:hypothetical protein [Bacteroidales bacterium]
MRKIFSAAVLILAAASCSKYVMDPLRLEIDNTFWSYSTETQTARVCFPDGEHASVLQLDMNTNSFQAVHGTYSLDGHRVLLTGDNWPNDIKFVRTFTHLKNNSTNRNLTPLKPAAWDNLAGSVWTTLVADDLHLVFFDHDGTCVEATFGNVVHKEGKPYGWEWSRKDYSLNGTKLEAGSVRATMFEDFLLADNISVFRTSPTVENTGSAALAGTVWTYDSSGYPGLIIFTSASTFTRVLVASRVVYVALTGTYKLSGAELTMTDGAEIKETCQLSADRFTFLEKNYVKVTLP